MAELQPAGGTHLSDFQSAQQADKLSQHVCLVQQEITHVTTLSGTRTRKPSSTQPSQPVTLILTAPTSTSSGTRLAPLRRCTALTQFIPSADLLCTCTPHHHQSAQPPCPGNHIA